MQVYAEDFLGGTTFMSNAEVGLYIRLLLQQVDKGALPDDPDHFAKAYGKECRKLWPVVRAKFIAGPEPGTIINERMAKAVADRDAFRLKQSEKGKLSASARSNTVEQRNNHGSTVVEPLGDGVSIKKVRKERANAISGFDAFWELYAYKKARPDAERAWAKLSEEERTACMDGLPAFVKATFTDGRFPSRPFPATFLNGKRWTDEVTAPTPTGLPQHKLPEATGWITDRKPAA